MLSTVLIDHERRTARCVTHSRPCPADCAELVAGRLALIDAEMRRDPVGIHLAPAVRRAADILAAQTLEDRDLAFAEGRAL